MPEVRPMSISVRHDDEDSGGPNKRNERKEGRIERKRIDRLKSGCQGDVTRQAFFGTGEVGWRKWGSKLKFS